MIIPWEGLTKERDMLLIQLKEAKKSNENLRNDLITALDALLPFVRYIKARRQLTTLNSRYAYPSLLLSFYNGIADIHPEDWEAAVKTIETLLIPEKEI